MPNKERLEELADVVEAYESFSQGDNDHCTITLAENLIDNNEGPRDIDDYGIDWRLRVANYFDITVKDVRALFLGNFENLGVGLENCADMDDVTRFDAATAIRALAVRG